jgi:hypothetical protein
MNADEIRRALFPHEETIKRLQEEIETLKARIAELEAEPVEEPKEKKRGGNTRKES